MRNSLASLLFETVSSRPDQAAIRTHEGRAMDWAELARRVTRIALLLKEQRIHRGDVVVCYLDETEPLMTLSLACAVAGIVWLPVSSHYSVNYVGALADRVDAKLIVCTSAQAQSLSQSGRRFVSLTDGADGRHEGGHPHEILREAADRSDPDAPLMLQPTSGSTGTPKLVIRSHRALCRNAHLLLKALGAPRHEDGHHRILAAAALTHGFGLSVMSAAVAGGCELLIPSQPDTNLTLSEVRALKPTVLPMPPRVLSSLARQHRAMGGEENERIFSTEARLVVLCGAKPNALLLRQLSTQGLGIVDIYGSSEASWVAMTPSGAWREGCAGKILPDVQFKKCPDGELRVSSPGLMLGYHGAPAQTANAFDEDGFYRTGDLAEVTRDGDLRLCGRKHDLFNLADGSNLSPEPLELAVEHLSFANQCILVGDQRSHLIALITVERTGPPSSSDADGYLDEREHRALYRRASAELAELNAGLEQVERIAAFALFEASFPTAVYALTGPSKIRRTRSAVGDLFQGRIDQLFALPLHRSRDVRVVQGGRPPPLATRTPSPVENVQEGQ